MGWLNSELEKCVRALRVWVAHYYAIPGRVKNLLSHARLHFSKSLQLHQLCDKSIHTLLITIRDVWEKFESGPRK